MALEVEWSDLNLEDLLPTAITTLVQDLLVPITDFISTSAEASKAVFEVLKVTSGFIPPTVDPILAGVQATIDTLTNLINDLQNAGGSLLLLEPQKGGPNQFGNAIRTALANDRIPEVPVFSSDAYIAAFGVMGFAPDVVTIDLVRDDIVSGVSASDNIVGKLGIPTLVETANFKSHDLKFKLAQSATPQPDTPWVTVQASQFIPKSEEIATDIKAYLSGTNTSIALNPLDELIALAQNVADSATQIATDLQTTAEFLESLFPDTSVKFFKLAPTEGGTEELSEATKDWFDTTTQENLSDVPKNSYTTGYIVVMGAPDLTELQTIYDIWDDLFLP